MGTGFGAGLRAVWTGGCVLALPHCVTSSPKLHTRLLWSRFRGQELRPGPAGSSASGSLADRHQDASRGWGLSRRPDRGRVRLQAHSLADSSIQLLELVTRGPGSSLAPSGPGHWASLWPAAQQVASSEQSRCGGAGRRTVAGAGSRVRPGSDIHCAGTLFVRSKSPAAHARGSHTRVWTREVGRWAHVRRVHGSVSLCSCPSPLLQGTDGRPGGSGGGLLASARAGPGHGTDGVGSRLEEL